MNVLFFAPATDALKDKHVGGTEKKITTYFRCVQQLAEQHEADARTPCISVIFIDEIDSLARSRDEDDAGGVQASATNSLLQMMDGFTTLGKVVVMAATNYPWQLDDAVLSRFQEKIYVRLPDTPTIIELLKHNLREFYTKALAHPSLAASDADAQKRYEMLVHIFGIESQALELLAGTFHVPATYSPSNIRDVCQQVFRKSAHHAHTQGVFYVVLVDVASDRFAALSRTEQNVLHSINHRYASAVTYKTLHAHFPEIIATATTKPANLRPSGSGSNRATVRPDSITLHSTLYVHSSAWVAANPAATEAQAALVVTLQRLTNMHVYVANANANAKYPLEYAIFKPYHVSYGPEKVSVFQTVARGTLSPTDVAYMQRYAASSLWMIHKLVEPFLRRTPAHLLLRGISEVHVRTPAATHHHHHHHHVEERDAAAAAATDPTPWWSFRVPPKGKLHGDWVDLSAHTTEQTALNLQQLPAYTTSGLERFVLWSVGDLVAKATSTSKAAEHARLQAVQFRRESPVVVHTHTEHTSQANARIQRSAFSLHIDMSLFVEAMDARYPDAIRPTSRAAEIKKLDAYWRGSSGS
jgi:tRNA A37 threonylcarbamoyladenosine synthetase subunit TsaC/SUA5/YrdC